VHEAAVAVSEKLQCAEARQIDLVDYLASGVE
jgi:hypothetical protein